jgi:hypothetical protein
MTTTKVPAKLQKVVDTHLNPDTTSSRAIQRAAALWIGHNDGKIERDALRGLCEALNLFDYEGRTGENNFGANFTINMKKDGHYFEGDHEKGWKLTAAGKAEAKAIFEDGAEPTRRYVAGGAKPKAPKAAKPKAEKKAPVKKAEAKKAEPKKAPAKKAEKAKPAAKAKAEKPTEAAPSEAERKAAAKRRALAKKRDLGGAPASESVPAPAPEAPAPAAS